MKRYVKMIYVLAMPSVSQQPQNTTILVNESLAVTCGFMAKHATNVTWMRGVSDKPNTTIIQITTTNTENGPYTVTTSSMTWKTSNLNDRRTVSDNYKCTAVNAVGMETSHTISLHIECE